MTPDAVRATVIEELRNIAPEIDPSTLAPDADLRDALDIDSIDFLNLVIALHRRLGVDIPEADHARMRTLAAMTRYLAEKLP
jgi:acyl carrier protein